MNNYDVLANNEYKKTPTVRGACLLFSIVVLSGLILSILVGYISPDISLTLNIVLSQGLIVILPLIISFIFGKYDIVETLKLKVPKLKEVILSIIMPIVFMPVSMMLGVIAMIIINLIFGNISLSDMSITNEKSPIFLAFLISVTPAIFEESLFRGVIQRGLEKLGPKYGIFLSGILFGFFHMDFHRFLPQAVLGMILAYFLYRTGSIICTMIIHFTNNFVSSIISLLGGSSGSDITSTKFDYIGLLKSLAESNGIEFQYFVIVLIILILIILAIFGSLSVIVILALRKSTKDKFVPIVKNANTRKIELIYLIPGLIVIFTMYFLIGYSLIKL